MKRQLVAWFVWSGTLALAAILFLAAGILFLQCLYWLKSDKWFDWTATDGPMFPDGISPFGHWRGVEEIVSLLVLAPVELGTFAAGVFLAVLYTWVRISSGK